MYNYTGAEAIDTLVLMATFHPEKEMKKLILKVLKRCQPHAKQGVQMDILQTKYKTYKEAIWNVAIQDSELSQVATELSDEGFPGMVLYNGEAYGVQIEIEGLKVRMEQEPTKPKSILIKERDEEMDWIRANEDEMKLAMAHAVMNHLNLHELECEVMLFTNRGFSGMLELLKIARGPERMGGQRVGNSNYFLV
jgi:hypothetical protein